MEKGTTISISLHTADRIIDLKVPSQVTVARLKNNFTRVVSNHSYPTSRKF